MMYKVTLTDMVVVVNTLLLKLSYNADDVGADVCSAAESIRASTVAYVLCPITRAIASTHYTATPQCVLYSCAEGTGSVYQLWTHL